MERNGGSANRDRGTLLTLPQLAGAVAVEYRTLHSWLQRGVIGPSAQTSSGTGVPNLFSRADAVKTKIIADLRGAGLSFDRLRETAARLDEHPNALLDGALVIVNGTVSVADAREASRVIAQGALTLVYNTTYAIAAIDESLSL